MFCPRAMRFFCGVTVCALLVGCGSLAVPGDELSRENQPVTAEPETVAMASAAPSVEITRPVSREEIINWSIRGLGDSVIIDRLEHSSTVFHLTTSDEIHLRDAGVSDDVVRAMRATAE